MANHIFITRHGETQWNAEKKIQGITDIPLTREGIKQAKELSHKIKEEKLQISEIIYSPLSRAADTARIIAEENNIPLKADPRLMEQNCGVFEGKIWSKNPDYFHEIKKQFASDFDGGESILRFAQRIYNFMDEIKNRALNEDKVFLLVTHGGVVKMVHSYFFSETNEEFCTTITKNCELKKYEFEYHKKCQFSF